MATTTQVTPYRSAGQPDDSVGAVGDVCFDTVNRIYWVKQSGNTWVGGGYSNIGPTGPAMLSGVGAPSSGYGQIGSGYTDTASGLTYYKSSSGWAQQGNILGPTGPAGAQGFTSLTNQAACFGGQVQSVGQTLTSTAQVMQNGGSTTTAFVCFPQASALMGLTVYNNGVACVVSLVDTTTNTAIYTAPSVAANSNYNTGVLSTTTYPLVANRVYQWMITGSGSSSVGVNAQFLQPSVLSNVGSGILSPFTTPANTTLSSTVQYYCQGNTLKTSASTSYAYAPIRAGALLGAVATYTPSTQGAASATATFTVYYYNQSGGASGSYATFSATNTGAPQAQALGSAVALNTSVTYYVGVSGSGTGIADIKLLIAV